MDGYRVYLKGELGKLKNPDDAGEFIDRSGCRLSSLRLPEVPEELAAAFHDQAAVDAFVDGLGAHALVALTDCFEWRNNGIPRKLRRANRAEYKSVLVGQVTLTDAEDELKPVFRALSRRLPAIATDERVHATGRYGTTYREVAYPILLAEEDEETWGSWRVVDGVHRAIQLYANGAPELTLCILRP